MEIVTALRDARHRWLLAWVLCYCCVVWLSSAEVTEALGDEQLGTTANTTTLSNITSEDDHPVESQLYEVATESIVSDGQEGTGPSQEQGEEDGEYYRELFAQISDLTMDSEFNTRVTDTREKLSLRMNFLREKEDRLQQRENELDEVQRYAYDTISKLRKEVADLKQKLLEKVREGRDLKHLVVQKDSEIADLKNVLKQKDLTCLKREKEKDKQRQKAREERIRQFETKQLTLEDIVFGDS